MKIIIYFGHIKIFYIYFTFYILNISSFIPDFIISYILGVFSKTYAYFAQSCYDVENKIRCKTAFELVCKLVEEGCRMLLLYNVYVYDFWLR